MGSGSDGRSAPALSVRLLGGFSVQSGDEAVPVESARVQSLLAHLILNRGKDLPRERLAYLFWPDSGESQARTNMRQALHRLRNTLPDADLYLAVDKSKVAWRSDAPAGLDVAEFEELASSDDAESLTRAVELYAGDLFPECYDDWIVPWRERLRERFLGATERLVEERERERDYRGALPLARQIHETDPLNEESVLRLMRLHALSGDRAAALSVYHGFATSLARETGVEPSPETRTAYERLVEPEDDAEAAEESSPFVGREDEWAALREAWRRASRTEAALVAITGEAGIGKSRLAAELQTWVARQGFTTAASKCYAAAGLAYAPVAEFLRSAAIADRTRTLGDPWLVDLSRLLPELRDDRPDLPPPLPLADEAHRTRLLEGVSRAVLAGESPLLLILDDVQWCDEETIDWIRYLLRSKPAAPLLILATARSEELRPEHPAQRLFLDAHAAGQGFRLDLKPLDAGETAALAESVAGHGLGSAGAETIFRETEGNALFVVEWARAGIADEPSHTPPRVQSVIESRLAQLSSPGQDLASLAATVGRAFRFDVLVSASSSSEEQVVDALDELTERRIVRELPDAVYDFSHDKLREAAYLRAGEARRRMLHRRVAQAIESHASDLGPVAAELAVHYEEAGWIDRAAAFYSQAGEAAHRVFSTARAVALFEKALSLLSEEPASSDRDRRELALQAALGAPLVSIEGYGAPRVHDVYLRAEELCGRLGTPPAPPVLRGLALVALARSELIRARELGQRLLEAGAESDGATVRVEGNYVLGATFFWLGEFERSREHLESALSEYDPAETHLHLALYSQDPRIVCLSRLALTLHYLGEVDEADERAREAIAYADALEHPFSLAYALNFAAWIAIERGDRAVARARVERMTSLVDDEKLGFLHPMGIILRGWLLSEEGATDEAIGRIREGLDAYVESGWSLHQPYALTLLARICLAADRVELARETVSEAQKLSKRTGQRYLDLELHQLEKRVS